MKSNLLFLGFLSFCLMTGCKSHEGDSAQIGQDTIPVRLVPLQKQAARPVIKATGSFTTDNETVLGFKNGGIIQRIDVQVGDKIHKGQVLAKVESTEIRAQTQEARSGLQKAQRDYDRAKRLYRDSVATLEQMQNAKTALTVAQQQLNAAQYNRGAANLRAPINGVVLAKLANVGQVVGAGTPVLQINGTGANAWKLKVGVNDRQWAQLQIGDTAQVHADALGDTIYKAAVTKKSKGMDPQSGTFQIWLGLTGTPKNKLAAGVFGKAKIFPRSSDKVWQIPYDAFIQGDGMTGYVFVTKDKKTAKKIKVKVQSLTSKSIVISKGLEDATYLIVSGSPYLSEGKPIKIENK